MANSRKQLRENLKKEYVELLSEYLNGIGEEVLRVGSNELAFPVTDADGNEDFVVLVVKIPTGANKGTEPYDGYAMAEDYELKVRAKEEKAKKAAEEKAKKIAKDEKRREKEQAIKEKREG